MTKRNMPKFYTSPLGRLRYPHILVPNTRFNPDGMYSADLILDTDASAKMLNMLSPEYDRAINHGREQYDAWPKVKQDKKQFQENPYFTNEYDEAQEPTGNLTFKFKRKAIYKNKKTGLAEAVKPPMLYDAKGNRIPPGKLKLVWSGTVAKVGFTVRPYWADVQALAGLQLKLQAVQIIDLVEAPQTGPDASMYGFEKEDGFEYREEEVEADAVEEVADPIEPADEGDNEEF